MAIPTDSSASVGGRSPGASREGVAPAEPSVETQSSAAGDAPEECRPPTLWDLEAGLRVVDDYHTVRDGEIAARQSDRRSFRLPTLWDLGAGVRAGLESLQDHRAAASSSGSQPPEGAQSPGEATRVEVPLPASDSPPAASPASQPFPEAFINSEGYQVPLNPYESRPVRVPERGFELSAGGQTYEVLRLGDRLIVSLKPGSDIHMPTRIFVPVREGQAIRQGPFELTGRGAGVVEIRFAPSAQAAATPQPVTHYSVLPVSDILAIDEAALGPKTNRGTFEETARPASRTQTAESAPSAVAQAAYGGAIGGIYGGLLHPINEGIAQCVDPAYVPYVTTVADTGAVYGLYTWYSAASGMTRAASDAAFAEGGPAVAAAATVVGRGVHTALEAAGVDTTSDAGRTAVAVTTGAGTGAAAAWMWPYLASTGPLGFGVGTVLYTLSDWQNNARTFTDSVDHALDDTGAEWCDPTRGECLAGTLEVAKDVVVDGATGLYRSAAYVVSGEALSDGYDWATDQVGYELCIPFYNCD